MPTTTNHDSSVNHEEKESKSSEDGVVAAGDVGMGAGRMGMESDAAVGRCVAVAAADDEAFSDATGPCAALPEPETEMENSASATAAATNSPGVSSRKRKGKDKPSAAPTSPAAKPPRKRKRRICKFPDCVNTIKAQGYCQRHGARTKRCKTVGCTSQAQGSHAGHCKRHWRETVAPADQRRTPPETTPEEKGMCDPVGASIYDGILPASFTWKAEGGDGRADPPRGDGGGRGKGGRTPPKKGTTREDGGLAGFESACAADSALTAKEAAPSPFIPILQHLLDHEHLATGWHRAQERLARGLRPPPKPSTQLDAWEKQLAVLEMALIAGTDTAGVSPQRLSRVLAHAWGREKGFHKLMLHKHCARRGALERKKRVDAGQPVSARKHRATPPGKEGAAGAESQAAAEGRGAMVPSSPAPAGTAPDASTGAEDVAERGAPPPLGGEPPNKVDEMLEEPPPPLEAPPTEVGPAPEKPPDPPEAPSLEMEGRMTEKTYTV